MRLEANQKEKLMDLKSPANDWGEGRSKIDQNRWFGPGDLGRLSTDMAYSSNVAALSHVSIPVQSPFFNSDKCSYT